MAPDAETSFFSMVEAEGYGTIRLPLELDQEFRRKGNGLKLELEMPISPRDNITDQGPITHIYICVSSFICCSHVQCATPFFTWRMPTAKSQSAMTTPRHISHDEGNQVPNTSKVFTLGHTILLTDSPGVCHWHVFESWHRRTHQAYQASSCCLAPREVSCI